MAGWDPYLSHQQLLILSGLWAVGALAPRQAEAQRGRCQGNHLNSQKCLAGVWFGSGTALAVGPQEGGAQQWGELPGGDPTPVPRRGGRRQEGGAGSSLSAPQASVPPWGRFLPQTLMEPRISAQWAA